MAIKGIQYVKLKANNRNPDALMAVIQEMIDAFEATSEASIIRKVDEAVRDAGYTGTKVHEMVVKAFSRITDGRDMMRNVIETLQEEAAQASDFNNEDDEAEGKDEDGLDYVEIESDDEPDNELKFV